MRFSIQKFIAVTATMAMLASTAVSVNVGAAYEETVSSTFAISVEGAGTGNGGSGIAPNNLEVHYDYDIPNFSLKSDETAFTTRYGYGFDVSKEGLNHNDFDITFTLSGKNPEITVAILTKESFESGNYDSHIASKTVTGTGAKEVNFYNLAEGTYVIKWYNNGTETISFRNVNLSTSY